MIIKRVVVGPLETNCYIAADEKTKKAAIIDPGAETEKIFDFIEKDNFKIKYILLTHNHHDHTGALEKIEKLCNLRCCAARESDVIEIGKIEIKAIETPGHTPDGICFVVEDPADGGAGNIFSGDTLFKDGIGRTDLKGGNFEQIKKSLKCLMEFPDNFKVWPGHGPETTIGEERLSNPFFRFL